VSSTNFRLSARAGRHDWELYDCEAGNFQGVLHFRSALSPERDCPCTRRTNRCRGGIRRPSAPGRVLRAYHPAPRTPVRQIQIGLAASSPSARAWRLGRCSMDPPQASPSSDSPDRIEPPSTTGDSTHRLPVPSAVQRTCRRAATPVVARTTTLGSCVMKGGSRRNETHLTTAVAPSPAAASREHHKLRP
jgi:hypothetical protein